MEICYCDRGFGARSSSFTHRALMPATAKHAVDLYSLAGCLLLFPVFLGDPPRWVTRGKRLLGGFLDHVKLRRVRTLFLLYGLLFLALWFVHFTTPGREHFYGPCFSRVAFPSDIIFSISSGGRGRRAVSSLYPVGVISTSS